MRTMKSNLVTALAISCVLAPSLFTGCTGNDGTGNAYSDDDSQGGDPEIVDPDGQEGGDPETVDPDGQEGGDPEIVDPDSQEGGDPETVDDASSPVLNGDSPATQVISRAKYWYDEGQAGRMGDYTNNRCPITGLDGDGTKDKSCHRDPEGNGVYPNTHFYRRDCSGMASMALHMGRSTNTAGFRSGDFDFEKLGDDRDAKPGDLVLSTATSSANSPCRNHTIIFEKWIDGKSWKGYSGGSMPPRHQTYYVSKKADGAIVNMDKNDSSCDRVFHVWRSPHVLHDTL